MGELALLGDRQAESGQGFPGLEFVRYPDLVAAGIAVLWPTGFAARSRPAIAREARTGTCKPARAFRPPNCDCRREIRSIGEVQTLASTGPWWYAGPYSLSCCHYLGEMWRTTFTIPYFGGNVGKSGEFILTGLAFWLPGGLQGTGYVFR